LRPTGRDEGDASPTNPAAQLSDEGQVQRLLRDIDRLAGQLRKVRNATGDRRNTETQVRALEANLRSKWEAVRTLRAKRSQPAGPLSFSRPRLDRGPR